MDASAALLFLAKFASWLAFPLSLAGLALLAAALWPGVPRAARALCLLALALLWGGGSRLAASALARPLEARAGSLSDAAGPADAIVVLGGGTLPALAPRRAPEVTDGGDRMLEAARLWREGRAARIVACGGSLDGSPPEAKDLATLLRFLGVAPEAILEEPSSRTTRENAAHARRLLEPLGARRVLLVTSALHMPRAAAHFRSEGFEVLPAPTDWLVVEKDPRSLPGRVLWSLPTPEGLAVTTRALREWLGLAVLHAFGSGRPRDWGMVPSSARPGG
jgi:uncharacterized SAM-binding protein YcdF (DUF218 family)